MDMKKLLEAVTKFAGEPEQKPGDQVRGTDKAKKGGKEHPFKGQLVGDSKDNMLKGLSQVSEDKSLEWKLAEAWANFNEDDIGVEPKRPARKGSRPSRAYTKNGKPSERYTSVKEGWGRGTDRVTIPDESTLYWSGNGPLQQEYDALYNELVPSQGKADTIEGEVLRAASKIVYRHYNDGDEFNQASFEQLVPYIGAVTSYDDLAHKATEFAMKANGNYTPNPNWDSLDVMEYGPEEDDYDDYEEDDSDWYDDEDEEDEDELDEVVNWPKEVPSDASQEQDDEDEPHPYGHDLDEGTADVSKIRQEIEQLKKMIANPRGRGVASMRKHLEQLYKDLEQASTVKEEWQDGADLISQWNIPQQEWARFETAVEDVLAATESDEAWEKFWQVINYDLQWLDRPLRDAFERGLGSMDLDEVTEAVLNGLRRGYESAGTEPRPALGLLTDIIEDGVRKLGMNEGWESGPEERSSRERDPDAEYDDMRQQKADAEAQSAQAKRPQKKYFTLSGRGPNNEPNYAFPGEYDTQDEAAAARAKLMADPKTPNPRDIGISTRTRYLDLKEGIDSTDPVESAVLSAVQELIQQGHTEVAPEVITNMVVAATSQPFLLKDLVDANKNSPAIQHYVDSINPTKVKFSSDILTVKNENPAKSKEQAQNGVANMAARAAGRNRLGEASTPLRDREDYDAKNKALQDIQLDPSTSKDPQLSAELARRKAELVQQAKQLGISESRAHKLIANKLKQIELQRQMGSPESDAAYAQHVDSLKKSKEEYLKKTPNTIYKREVNEYGADQPAGTAAPGSIASAVDPKKVAQVQQATNTLKSATGSTAPTTNIAKALDSASQGTSVGATDMKVLEPMMKDIATIAQDPKLANQYRSLAGQINQTQQKQQQQK